MCVTFELSSNKNDSALVAVGFSVNSKIKQVKKVRVIELFGGK